MRKLLARWLYPTAFQYREDYERQAQVLHVLREDFRLYQKAHKGYTQTSRIIEEILAEGIFSARLYLLADGVPVLLRLHHAQSTDAWEFRVFQVHQGVRDCCGWLSATVQHIDYFRPLVSMSDAENRYFFIHDFKLRAECQGKGLGSYMLQTLAEIGNKVTPVCRIEGKISYVDWDHVDQLERLYSRHGYTVALDRPDQSGTIVKWLK